MPMTGTRASCVIRSAPDSVADVAESRYLSWLGGQFLPGAPSAGKIGVRTFQEYLERSAA